MTAAKDLETFPRMWSQKARLSAENREDISGEERLEVRGFMYRRVTAEKT